MTLRPSSIRGRLTLWYVAALAVFLAVAEGVLFLRFQDALTSGTNERLRAVTDSVVHSLGYPEPGDPFEEVKEILSGPQFQSQEISVALFDRSGRLLYGTPNAEKLAFIPGVRGEAWTILGRGETSRKVRSVVRGGYVVEVALPWGTVLKSVERLGMLLVILFIVFLAVAGVGGWLLVGAVLRPIESITDAANRINADSLSERLPAYTSDREIRGLVATFNTMLGRLEGAFDSHRRFTADASHELRTPITILQNEVEVGLSRPRSDDEYRKILGGVLEEARRMARLVNDMLLLARNDALPEVLETAEVPLDDLCRLVGGEFCPQAEAKGLRLEMDGLTDGLSVPGDPERLRRLLENLVDNAVKYTPSPGEVRLSLHPHNGWAVIVVEDTGPGIAGEYLSRLFERFYRLDKSRSRSYGGSGLGLSICQQLARLHGGYVTVESASEQGSRFMVWLPHARLSDLSGAEPDVEEPLQSEELASSENPTPSRKG